ncbi:MAG: hypothetical protein IPM89_11280 [Candidatus Competibacteraceae bacterium]|nr:MAG: hypothetical protein IPM89_11280 [Candidatus Competibacteraceae bacterium]
MLESPAAGAFVQSGVGLIRGWACAAQRIEFSLDGGSLQAIAYGTDRPDTAALCGDSDNGFGFTQNWGEIGDGVHNLRAFADGVEFANVNFTVTTLGRAFLTGLRAQYTLRDFPAAGNEPQVRWSEPQQNFVFARQATIPANTPPSTHPRAALEAPAQGSYQSGVELIRGWACEGQRVEFSLDGGARQAIAYGTDRPDTQSVCGDTNNGFGFTYNWNRLGEGTHNLRAYLDGVEFANVNFAVTTLGAEYLTGLRRQYVFDNFPETGQTTTAEWSEPQQNFIVARSTATPSRLALIAAITDVLNPMAVAGNGTGAALGESTGVIATKRGDGVPTRLEGITWASRPTGQSADLSLADDGLPDAYIDSSGVEARFSDYQLTDAASSVTVSFFRNGAAQGTPATVPVEGAGLRALQTMAERVRLALQSTPASTGRQVAPAVSTAAARQPQDTPLSRFTLSALLVNSYWYGSVAAGETLCAVRAAADQAGVSGLVAPAACQSPLITAFLARAATRRGTAAAPPVSGIDPLVQQALRADADVVEAPCGPAGGGVSCLEPVASQLQTRQDEDEQTPVLPREEPTDAVLPPPTGVDASDGTFADRVRITWNAVAGAIAYEVYRDGFLLGSPTGTAFEDTDVAPGATHAYTIRACNAKGCGGLSNSDDGYAQAQQTVTYLVTATAGPGGTISPPSQTVNAGATTSFTVTPDSGYVINSVTGCGGSLGGTTYTTGPITAPCTVTASFSALPPESYLLTLTTTGTGSGTVGGGGGYPAGTSVTLTATPDVSSTFAGWSPSPCAASFTMPAQSLACTATFTLKSYTVTATASGGGTISPPSQTVDHGATASFTVTPDSDYQIASVTGCGGSLGGTTYTTGPITAPCTVTASFSALPPESYLLTLTTTGTGSGTVGGGGGYPAGTSVTLTATPDVSSTFAGWSPSPCAASFTMPAQSLACTATFTLKSYTVTATASGGGTISPPSQTVDHGATASFTVTPDSDYQIASVTGCGGSLGGTTYTTGPITAPCTITASFSLATYLVTATAGPGGTISPPSQTVGPSATASFIVTPDPGYYIDTVTGCGGSINGGEYPSSSRTYTTSPITADCTVTASFRLATYVITATAGSGGTISPSSQTVDHGATASFTVFADDYYYVYSVDGCGGSYVGDDLGGTYTTGPITEECTVTAGFWSPQ